MRFFLPGACLDNAEIGLYHGWYNLDVLPDLQLDDTVQLRKAHPCGSFHWRVIRLGADIGLECCQCGRRVMLSRRELARRLKTVLTRGENAPPSQT